jgi:hypothetical protein
MQAFPRVAPVLFTHRLDEKVVAWSVDSEGIHCLSKTAKLVIFRCQRPLFGVSWADGKPQVVCVATDTFPSAIFHAGAATPAVAACGCSPHTLQPSMQQQRRHTAHKASMIDRNSLVAPQLVQKSCNARCRELNKNNTTWSELWPEDL